MGREVMNHHCGGAVGPMYRKPHLEARKKCIMRTAPRAAATSRGTTSIVTSAILAGSWRASET